MAAQTMQAVVRPESGQFTDSTLDEDDRPRARWERAVGWSIVAIATWLVWCILDANHDWGIHVRFMWTVVPRHVHFTHFQFGDLFRNTTTNGGDMGAHVWWPQFLEKNWFPKLRLSGWAPDWYAGFPVGEYYFPLPAVLVAIVQHLGFHYNVAFKLVTVMGPLMLPAAAYYFARGMRTPWPAPPAFALAGLGMLVQTRNDWQIYGGNLASTLAGEFSFSIGLAFALFGLGALARSLDTGRRRWLPAVLIAAAVMSHIVVAIFIAVAALLLWATRRGRRTLPLAAAIGGVALLIPMVWLLPLVANQAYTQSMRYTKVVPQGTFKLGSWASAVSPISALVPVHHTITDFVRAIGSYVDPSTHKSVKQALWLPWWIWLLAGVAIIAAGWYRRRSTLVLLVLAAALGVMFIEWPADFAIWNTRFLPFWLLTWGFIAAMGAAEICRLIAGVIRWSYGWIRDGDLQDARARAYAEIATAKADDPSIDTDARNDAAWALAERRFGKDPQGWTPPTRLAPATIERQKRHIGTVALAVVVVLAGGVVLNRAWDARDNNNSIVPVGWAQWNYSGYEASCATTNDKPGCKSAYPQYKAVMDGMNQVADTYGNGRALWEPSSGEPDAINTYGTSLALELLPLFTHGRIDSMEGIYFESAATTSYHFLTVAECAEHPSNPVRGLKYGTLADDFDLCVRHLQMLGVRYLMLWTPEANAKAARSSDLTLIKDIPGAVPGTQLKDWKVYEVANSDLVVGMDREPVVAKVHGGKYSQCWHDETTDTPEPVLGAWECAVAPWWESRSLLDTPFTQTGPKQWQHVDIGQLGSAQDRPIDPVQVSDVRRNVDTIQFHVSDVGKPVLVKESYFPNWHVKGAKGPYRVAPNFMVVIPTSHDVKLTYGLTPVDWAGRLLTVVGLAGLVFLARWKRGRRFAADPSERDDIPGSDEDEPGNGDAGGDGSGNGRDDGVRDDEPDPEPPEHREPAPALP